MLEIDLIHKEALNQGFKWTAASKDGTTLWFRKSASHPEEPEQLMCIDFITRSGTVFWKRDDLSVDSATFRNAESLCAWLDQPWNTSAMAMAN